ncbi:MAG TPA: hypothetical protein VHZ98_10375 [Galbitalea sp.]|jgi:hypothetical protein|nr:hypothetical protein [Galbitalea sp.]
MSGEAGNAFAEIFADYFEAQAKRRRESELLALTVQAYVMKAELDAEAVRVQMLIRFAGELAASSAQRWTFLKSSTRVDASDKR